MKIRHMKRLISSAAITLVLLLCYNAAFALTNAINQHVPSSCTAIASQGYIEKTIPPVNGPGSGVYQRVAITTQTAADPNTPASAFAELGWLWEVCPCTNGERWRYRLASWTTASGGIGQYKLIYNDSNFPNPERYTVQYDRAIQEWLFYANGQLVTREKTNFNQGCAVIAGGETFFGTEGMGYTDFSELKWLKLKGNGTTVLKPWATNTIRLHQAGYTCIVLSSTSHYCYHPTKG